VREMRNNGPAEQVSPALMCKWAFVHLAHPYDNDRHTRREFKKKKAREVGGVGELLACFPLRSADLGRAVSPGVIDFRLGRGVSGVYSGVGGLRMLLSSPRPAVVAREWKSMAPLSSSLGFFRVFF
jgi:hypothetical protein